MKKIFTKFTLISVSCIALAGCGSDDQPADKGGEDPKPAPAEPVVAVNHPLPGDPVAGEAVYTKICSACHQPDGSGLNGMLAADFVKDKTRLAKSNEVLIKSIRDGITVSPTKVMPPLKDVLTDQEIKDAISYVRKTFGGTS